MSDMQASPTRSVTRVSVRTALPRRSMLSDALNQRPLSVFRDPHSDWADSDRDARGLKLHIGFDPREKLLDRIDLTSPKIGAIKVPYILIINVLTRSDSTIADLYKERCQIEMRFKWLKQSFKINRFLGRNENAVKTAPHKS